MTEPVRYACNALIEGREPHAFLKFTDCLGIGHWIQGTATLNDAHVRFSMTRSTALLLSNGSDLIIPYDDVTACKLGRLAYVLKTVDLETTRHGLVRFRCLIAWNERLLEDLHARMAAARSGASG